MTTQISVETLSPITHNQIPVITTELLAQLYCTEINNIKVNYTRNSERFVEGKHFFKVVGDELKNLRVTLSNSQNLQPSLRGLQISPKARSLILWTERGAARHAKMLETDQAWDVFEKLEDCYFSQKRPSEKQESVIEGDGRTVVIRFDEQGNVKFTREVPNNAVVCTVERFRLYLEEHGWIVVHKGQLVERLMQF
ncbi:ORF6N domain-containing protein [Salmonella enterica]|uniref:ORF6N domain-containing protein n=2 Tax=Enterobacteriaceae TaxID=543 RepID=A0A5U9SNG0_SALET|nr:ORF6N domain-containing protein [Salmonella enterica]EAB9748897.1 ORF6N domain-containing protein [Salmonella enterica subsp. salamae]EBS4094377.1 ORF6N domain-containing protein [Salmonella enterica subsp. enterica serovar Bareilly]EDA8239709.1 ORF6N domain-containing protein [Salmonella enterica subsp. enterica serovar Reading]EDI0784456.1 ORF6N domain-containing protein [Salmonella enterica subsp. enterica serovar Kasenyi]EDS9957949.1 ORF6N domain-containing protein [Salmonella enterica 